MLCRSRMGYKRNSFLTIMGLCFFILTALFSGCATQKTNMEVTPMSKLTAHESIDLRGKTITTYVLYYTVEKLQNMHEGEILEVVTDDYKAIENDILAWTRMTGHKLRDHVEEENYYIFYIEKSSPIEVESSLAIVISNNGLTELLSPLGFALAAALEGIDVYLYFQGPGVKILKQGYRAKLKGFGRPFSNAARNGMAKAGHISPQDKLQQLKSLGAHIYVCAPSMDRFKVRQDELIFDDVVLAAYMTFTEIMHNADIQIYVQ